MPERQRWSGPQSLARLQVCTHAPRGEQPKPAWQSPSTWHSNCDPASGTPASGSGARTQALFWQSSPLAQSRLVRHWATQLPPGEHICPVGQSLS